MNDTYLEYLGESTDKVKSNNRLTKAVMIAATVIVYAITQYVFWVVARGQNIVYYNIVFKYVLLPLTVLLMTLFTGKNNWWGKGKWILVPVFAALLFLVPVVSYEAVDDTMFNVYFYFPNLKYLFVGCGTSLIGLLAGERFSSRCSIAKC